ncbi:MAG: GTPase HflX [Methanomassiliicoccales archaeon]|nr:GTPase HflX [Methanomassiliicoccales archaeon]
MSERVDEIEQLAISADYSVSYEVIQRRSRPDPTTFLGKGKIEELGAFLSDWGVDTLIINGDLKPTQHYILESALKVECVDRIRLVLEIFTSRAASTESKLQVEKARLKYEIPLLREWIHSAKKGEHPGFLGGGEYAVDVYYDLIKKRMGKIDEELRRLGDSKDQKRIQRKKKGFNLISLAGYTNAGKSSLMRRLTGEQVLVEDRLFSTLSTTTKRLLGSPFQILVTDTIGFMSNLPPFVIEAFKSTITEIFNADLILLVVDASEDWDSVEKKITTSEKILFPEVELDRVFLVLNKIDRLDEMQKNELMERLSDWTHPSDIFMVSAITNEGLDALTNALLARFSHRTSFDILLPQTGGTQSLLTWLRRRASISQLEYSNEVHVIGTCDEIDLNKLRQKVAGLNGTVISIDKN